MRKGKQLRRSVRLADYDYRQPGAYFVTICTDRRVCCLAKVESDEIEASRAGQIVLECWDELEKRFPTIFTDSFVIMPNHIHGIIFLGTEPDQVSNGAYNAHERHSAGAINRAATNELVFVPETPIDEASQHVVARFIAPASANETESGNSRRSPTLGEVVRHLKASSTYRIRASGFHTFAWQRNYYEHIIRNDASLDRIRGYILSNPSKWAEDEDNPDRTPTSN